MSILVAGGGVEGLACAIELSKSNQNITLVDARQEIGTPTFRPGYYSEESSDEWLNQLNLPPQVQIQSFSQGWGLRMEWLEKTMATRASEKGIEILVKTRITGFEDSTNTISVRSAGPGAPLQLSPSHVIDCLGIQPPSPGSPGEPSILGRTIPTPLIKWFGSISTPKSESMKDTGVWDERLIIPRADGTVEHWRKGAQPERVPDTGWLETMHCYLEDETPPSLDIPISQGIQKAEEYLNQ